MSSAPAWLIFYENTDRVRIRCKIVGFHGEQLRTIFVPLAKWHDLWRSTSNNHCCASALRMYGENVWPIPYNTLVIVVPFGARWSDAPFCESGREMCMADLLSRAGRRRQRQIDFLNIDAVQLKLTSMKSFGSAQSNNTYNNKRVTLLTE